MKVIPGSSVAARDAAVCEAYRRCDETADQIVSDPIIAESFCEQVNCLLHDDEKFTVAELNKRLLNLRRRGEENGGLIRKQRAFRGRGAKPR